MTDIAGPKGSPTVIRIDDLSLPFAQIVDPSNESSLRAFTNHFRDQLLKLRPDIPVVLALMLTRDMVGRMVGTMLEEHDGPSMRAGCLRLTTTMRFTETDLEIMQALEEQGQELPGLDTEVRHVSSFSPPLSPSSLPLRRIHLLSAKQAEALKERGLTVDDLQEPSTASPNDGDEDNDNDVGGDGLVDISLEKKLPLNAKKVVNLQVNVEDPACLGQLVDQLFDEGLPLEDIRSLIRHVTDQMSSQFPGSKISDLLPAVMARLDASVGVSGKSSEKFASGSESAEFSAVRERSIVMSPSSRRLN